MALIDIIDEIIRDVDPEQVPPEYIIMAKIKNFSGEETFLRGAELEAFLKDPQASYIAEARVVFNVKAMRRAVVDEVEAVFEDVGRLLQNHS